MLTMAEERLSEDGRTKLLNLLEAGDPKGEVATAWHAKEAVRELYSHQDQPLALRWLDELSADLADGMRPPEVRSLGRTLKRWRSEITAWHTCHFTNGPREAMNNLIIRVKRVAFGFTSSGTTASGRCFTQASLTGHCSRPSPPTETRRAHLNTIP